MSTSKNQLKAELKKLHLYEIYLLAPSGSLTGTV